MKGGLSPIKEGDGSHNSHKFKRVSVRDSRQNVADDPGSGPSNSYDIGYNRHSKKGAAFNHKSYQIKKDANAQMNQATSVFESKIEDMKTPRAEQYIENNSEQSFEITN